MHRRTPRFVASGIESLTAEHVHHDLAESVGPDLLLGELVSSDELRDIALGYGSAEGDAPLRARIAALHGVAADDVVITVGGMHALFLLALATLERGDAAVLATPVFPNARQTLEAVRADVRVLELGFANRYRLDVDALGAMLDPNVRLVSLASPQNPSGVSFDETTIGAVLEVMGTNCPDAVLLIDETYREAVYGDAPIAASAVSRDARIVSCGSLSKCHGAPGLRVGWAITRDASLREQLVLAKFNTVISLSRVDEWLAIRVLERAESLLAERRTLLADGLSRVAHWVEDNEEMVDWVRPDAGALCCVRLAHERFDIAAIARFHAAARARSVRVAPGDWFGDADDVFRLGFGWLTMPELDNALASLGLALCDALGTERPSG